MPCSGGLLQRGLLAIFALALLWVLLGANAQAAQAAESGAAPAPVPTPVPVSVPASAACSPQLVGSWGAKEIVAGQRPADGWQVLKIPHAVPQAWPGWNGPVWYRLDWQLHCQTGVAASNAQLALAIAGIRLAGTVYWNDALLWSDRSLKEPFSRSWNMPRWWPVSVHNVNAVQTAWVRVVSPQGELAGLGYVKLGPMAAIQEEYDARFWRQRISYVLTAGLSLTLTCVALVVWLWRRSERLYLWMGLMELCWTLYLSVILSLGGWPGISSSTLMLLNVVFFMLYGHCFLIFVLRFHGQYKPRVERTTWAALALWTAYIAVDSNRMRWMSELSLTWGVVVLNGACLYAIYRALRVRQPQNLLLGAACAVIVVVAVHDIEVALRRWDNDLTWSYILWPLNMVILAVLLGWQVAQYMRRMDHFNEELSTHVTQARAELAQVLEREHQQALQHAKLQERVQLAHDLHDGLGGSLVRSMALVEQAPQQLSNERVMSLLKTLRDDLRQVIDTGSSAAVTVPETPGQWLAPLRHRFMRILDEVGMQGRWQMEPAWQQRPSALQCMELVRFLEEAFANVLKHSQARSLSVRCWQPTADTLALCVSDDGLGFDVPSVQAAGMSVGMRSMQSRVARIGGRLEVQSVPGCTQLTAWVQLAEVAAVPSLAPAGAALSTGPAADGSAAASSTGASAASDAPSKASRSTSANAPAKPHAATD